MAKVTLFVFDGPLPQYNIRGKALFQSDELLEVSPHVTYRADAALSVFWVSHGVQRVKPSLDSDALKHAHL